MTRVISAKAPSARSIPSTTSPSPMFYTATNSDHRAGTLPADALKKITQSIHHDGFAVVGNLVSQETRDILLPTVLEDADIVRSGGELTPHEQRTAPGHLQLGLRRTAPFVRADLVANPLIESVVAAVLGEGAWLGFYNGNVNCPGSGEQPLHFDRPYSWRTVEEAKEDGQDWPPPTTTLSCSVALTEITEESGATEIYPGSQRETEVATWTTNRLGDRTDLTDAWGPPARMEIPAGGVCFRDPRMWHRGVPNHADAPRPMLAVTYHAAIAHHWRGRYERHMSAEDLARCQADSRLKMMDSGELADGRLVFHESTRPIFSAASEHGINRNVRFVTGTVDHLHSAHEVGGAAVIPTP